MIIIKIEAKNNIIKIIFFFNSYKNFSISSESALKMIHESLKLKISKKIIEKVCKNQLKIKKYEGDFISLRIYFNLNDEIDDHETMSEIPDEGKPVFIYENSNIIMRKSSSLIDILIVDDIEFNIDILKRLISNLKSSCKCGKNHKDLSIHTASSGKQAINSIIYQNSQLSGYKIVLMDCMMPELDGWEACKQINELFVIKIVCTNQTSWRRWCGSLQNTQS